MEFKQAVENSRDAHMHDKDVQRLVERLCRTETETVFFPVRHHSPTAAQLVGQLIHHLRPASVLIEGPGDFNEFLDELLLDHQLPIAIYSYFQTQLPHPGGEHRVHRGVFYPFCAYSPEWVAIREAAKVGAQIRLIDLPWAQVAQADAATHRYADGEMRRGAYVQAMCERLEVEDFDDLWDRLIESQRDITLEEYLQRVHAFCLNTRLWEQVSECDRQREAFMAEQIRQATKDGAPTLIVTGGYHSSALVARLEGFPCNGIEAAQTVATPVDVSECGISLTTYSYERLDNLTGYNSGMPNPGFYDVVWRQRTEGRKFSHRELLQSLVTRLRDRKQILSTADLVAVETSARALAALRGREHVWRRDLVDAVTVSLMKDELEYGCTSPFVEAIHEVLRGDKQGQLAAGTRVPPLVNEIRDQLTQFGLLPQKNEQRLQLDLLQNQQMQRSRLLHRLRLLDVRGITHTGGTDFLARDQLDQLWENWTIQWTPEFESSCIEASRYGVTLQEAVTSRFLEMTRGHERDAAIAAKLLVEAAHTGIETLTESLLSDFERLITTEPELTRVTSALEHLLFLFCFDEAFGTVRSPRLFSILNETMIRSIWLLELIGRTAANDAAVLRGLRVILETWQRVGLDLELDAVEFTDVIKRVQSDGHKPPQVRGAAGGILWTIGQTDAEAILSNLRCFADPVQVGDYLTGLFALAREVVQRHPKLVQAIDETLLEFGAEEFLAALPALRLAFTSFTPREKHHMLSTLFESLEESPQAPRNSSNVDSQSAAQAAAMEEQLFAILKRYGLEERDDQD